MSGFRRGPGTPRGRGAVLAVAAAALACAVWQLSVGTPPAQSLPAEIWGLEVDGVPGARLDLARLDWTALHARHLNAILLGGGLTGPERTRLREAATRAGLSVLAPVRGRTIQSAVARSAGAGVVAVRLHSIRELRELSRSASRGRIIAVLALGGERGLRAAEWREAIELVRLSPQVDLAVVPAGPHARRALAAYLDLLALSLVPDTVAPTAPGAPVVRSSTVDSITLAWARSRDNRGRVGYALSRDGRPAGTSLVPSFTYIGLACSTSYTLAVVAYNAAHNRSAKATLKADTAPCPSYVSTTGSDANRCTQSAPCLSFDRAYHLAKPRQQVIVGGGTYPEQTLTADATKTAPEHVVFVEAPGQEVALDGGLEVRGASHLTVRGFSVRELEFYYPSDDVTAQGIDDNGHLGIWGASNVTVRGGEVYETTPSGNDPAIGADSFGQGTHVPKNILIDGVYFHDWQMKDPSDHIECIQIWLADGLTIRNSRFRHCAHHALFINQYAPALEGSSLMRNVTIENNFFDNPNVGFYAIQIRPPNTPGVPCDNFLIRNNSFLQGTFIDCTGGGNRVESNIMPSIGFGNCDVAGWSYAYNLVAAPQSGCGATNLAGKADFVDAAAFDLHLRAGSPGIGRGDPRGAPNTDIDGQARPRQRRPDIGADQYEKPR